MCINGKELAAGRGFSSSLFDHQDIFPRPPSIQTSMDLSNAKTDKDENQDIISRFTALLEDPRSNIQPNTVWFLVTRSCWYINQFAEPIDGLDWILLWAINALLKRRLRRRKVAGLQEGASWQDGHVNPELLKALWIRQLCSLVFSVGVVGVIFGSWSVMRYDRCERT